MRIARWVVVLGCMAGSSPGCQPAEDAQESTPSDTTNEHTQQSTISDSVGQGARQSSLPDAVDEADCPHVAETLLDTAITAARAGAYGSIDQYYGTGADTLGFHGSFGNAGQSWYVSAVSRHCLAASATRAAFAVAWTVAARVSGHGPYHLEQADRVLVDTVTVTYRWLLNDLDFLIGAVPLQRARGWDFSTADRQFVDSLVMVQAAVHEPADTDSFCPPQARTALHVALDRGIGSTTDTLGFIRHEGMGDDYWLIADASTVCQDGSDSDATFAVSLTTIPIRYTAGGAKLSQQQSRSTFQVSLARRWVIDDLRPLANKVDIDLLREMEFYPLYDSLLESIAPVRPPAP